MSENVFVAAKHLACASNWRLNNLALQKLLYIAHMFSLSNDGAPLVAGQFYATDCGPIHPQLYHKAKVFGARPVGNVFYEYPQMSNDRAAELLDHANHALGNASPALLVAITQRKHGAWATSYIPGAGYDRGIPNADIRTEGLRLFSAIMRAGMEGLRSPDSGRMKAP
jgi:uncharacterized phage-associated protein